MNTYYTRNLTTESYTSINLVCNATNIIQAFNKFKKYLEKEYPNDSQVSINIKDIKRLGKKIKEFYCNG